MENRIQFTMSPEGIGSKVQINVVDLTKQPTCRVDLFGFLTLDMRFSIEEKNKGDFVIEQVEVDYINDGAIRNTNVFEQTEIIELMKTAEEYFGPDYDQFVNDEKKPLYNVAVAIAFFAMSQVFKIAALCCDGEEVN